MYSSVPCSLTLTSHRAVVGSVFVSNADADAIKIMSLVVE